MLHEALIEAAEALHTLQIRYAIGGSVASGVHGIIRFVNDVDFTVDLSDRQSKLLLRQLRDRFYVPEEQLPLGQSVSLIHLASASKVHMFPSTEDFNRAELLRASPVALHVNGKSLACHIESAEDVILSKLHYKLVVRLQRNSGPI
jgi:hypothetical protein